MFTGLVSAVSRVVSLTVRHGGRRPRRRAPAGVRRRGRGGEHRRLRRLPDGRAAGGSRPAALFRRLARDALALGSRGPAPRARASTSSARSRASDRLGGHVVAGHVDGTAEVLGVERSGDSWTFRFSLPAALARYAVEKGSISVDGISLTIAALREGSFDVAVIPHTFTATTLGERKAGDLRQPRGGRPREVRRAAPRGAARGRGRGREARRRGPAARDACRSSS